MKRFKWTVYTISLHSPTDQSKLLFSLLDVTHLIPIDSFFCQKIRNTQMAYGKNTCIFLVFFGIIIHSSSCHFSALHSSLFRFFLLFIPHSHWMFIVIRATRNPVSGENNNGVSIRILFHLEASNGLRILDKFYFHC